MKSLFTGCGTALITPLKGGEIDWDTLDQLVEEQIAGGVDALIATGTTGAPVLVAMRNAPPLNSPMPPSSPL